ncbi:phytoene desaturase family protein [Natrarchaeobius chitinivorans]|uniref:Phytoene desaturase n=1 Tax=Natrarchaeobius chitinivorans TaxID=1679083 RepID=A0A3N6MI30_NATCH|nr:phytoene desaturase family protein [Natrarchaeobius chitinivorans]RQG96610.1 phytoene desaturase [Natrarchaeobius chitinivorans]
MQSLAGESVVVVGAGVGGLSTACYLADAGAEVRVVEKNDQLGGRASRLERDGFRFDMGPSWYLMPDVFERFFADFDRTPSDYYELTQLDPHYRIFFKEGAEQSVADGSGTTRSGETGSSETAHPSADARVPGDRVDITPDLERTKAVFEEYEEGAGESLERYLETSRKNYEVGMKHFVYEDRTRVRDYLDLDVARQARGLSLLGSMQGHVEDYFEHPKLQQIMQYTLVFLGGSPTNTPALYNLMSHVDFNLGVWYPQGGIGRVIDAFEELGRELGVEYETGRPVTAIKGREGAFLVETTDGPLRTDLVVSNADYAHTEMDLLTPERRGYDAEYWESRTYAPSAFLLYLGVEGDVDELAHHTLVLPAEWTDHFDRIFEDPEWPEDPAYYVCVPSKTDDSVAPEGHSALFVLVPIAPGLDDPPEIRAEFRETILADLAENAETDLRDRIVFEERFCVDDFASRYNSFQGTALGLAHTLRQTSLFRPPHRSSEVEGLYFVGGDTTPGIGVPMCLISGKLTAEAVLEDYGGPERR